MSHNHRIDQHGFDRLGRVDEENSTVSAPSRFAANEKLLRVRVLFSKKRFAIVRPFKRSSLVLPFEVAA
jgi:hypothetical protein